MRKIALVTGGSSGIGYATAQLLKEKNYDVIISGRNAEKVAEVAQEMGARSLAADMADVDDLGRLASEFSDSGLDILVNNAGTIKFVPIGQYDAQQFSTHFDTNVRGPLLLIQALLPALEMRKGSITTISSIIVTHGAPGAALYAATKGAVEAFTRTLALELAPKNVRINAVAPGAIDTPIFSKMGLTQEQQAMLAEQHKASIPMGRLGSPQEVAQVVVAQLESTYVTGSVWTVDGGVDA